MLRIDAHIHFNADSADALEHLKRNDLKLLNICVAQDSHGGWRVDAEHWIALTKAHPDRFGWITSFDLPRFEDKHYAEACIEGLERDFHDGAVGVKIWKNIGMDVKKPDGSWMFPDDPLLTPIVECVERNGKTLLMHIAEPLGCWRPLVPGTPHYGYYKAHPEWHMYNKPENASHERLMEARDALVARHPKLRMVGAHFASLEYDVTDMAKRFNAYPNFAVDTSARLGDMLMQDSKKVRQFFLDYQDRILYGTDYVNTKPQAEVNPAVAKNDFAYFRELTDSWWAYLTTAAPVKFGEQENQGLGLPASVVEKVYLANAHLWYPGL